MQLTHPSRTSRHDALAAGVSSASEAAVVALHAATDDRRFIHEQEWGQSAHDTLADIDEFADTLQGFASWVVGGKPHQQPARVLNILRDLRKTAFDLRAVLQGKQQQCSKLQDYVCRLEELRLALLKSFGISDESNAHASSSEPGALN